ncbi:MAG: hypothetical protein J1E16_10000 [Muribaculaceae bacterium]|nr:hypothetical protein [Muribaculaceae bacterium]
MGLFDRSSTFLESVKSFPENIVNTTKETAEKGVDVVSEIGEGGLESVGIVDDSSGGGCTRLSPIGT